MNFEDNLKKLEKLVARMEGGEMKLDDAIAAFEEGRRLAAECQKELEAVKLRIEKVAKTGETVEFEA